MTQFILGRAGSGKTETVLSRIAKADTDRPIWLLVPEQFSFATERTLIDRFGVQGAAAIQVFSFTRLAQRVLRETGAASKTVLDDVTRALLMSRALELHTAPEQQSEEETAETHRLYDPEYLRSLLALSDECKQCAVSPRMLELTANALPDGTLKHKLTDLSGLFSVYDGLVSGKGLDPDGLLSLAAEKLVDSDLADRAQIFVDGFKGFTAVELDMLAALMRNADLTVTLCTNTAHPDPEDAGLFAPAARSLRQLTQLAADHGITLGEPLVLQDNHRAHTPALRALESGAFAARSAVYEGEAEEITVTPCSDRYLEAGAAARAIRRTLRETGLRARDIAVIVRHIKDYAGMLDAALRREEIPFYMDTASDIYTEPLPSLMLSALRVCTGGWQTEELLRILKTGLLPFDETAVAALENYVYIWRIDGKRWDKPFTANPEGLTDKSRFDREGLNSLETLRRQLIGPLKTLKKAIGDRPDGRTLCAALYDYLTDPAVQADAGVRRLYNAYLEENEPVLTERTARLWDRMMELIDRVATVFEGHPMPARRYVSLFHLAIGLTRLPSIPQSIDAVQVGSADHVRLNSPKAVFVLGANEGVFPAYPADSNLLSDHDRQALDELGLSLSSGRLQKAEEERFYAYLALSAPSDALWLSYAERVGNEEALPSAIIETVRHILPNHQKGIARAADGSDIESPAEAFERLAAVYETENGYTASLRAALAKMPDFAARFETLDHATRRQPMQLSPDNAKALFGSDMRLSASQTDSFFRCHFRYFCQYGMRLKTRRVADVDAPLFGTFAHYVMEKLLPEYVGREQAPGPADIPVMQRRIREILHQFVEEEMGGFEEKTARFTYLLSLVERTCFSLLWFTAHEMAQSQFTPVDYELSIGGDGVPSPVFELPDRRGSVRLIGKIDRVDLYRRADTVFIRVVDYKTGSKEFKLSEIPYGINMQLLLYLFTVCAGASARYQATGAAPAGILYLPAKDITLKNTRVPLDESRLKLMRMNGLLLADTDVLMAMDATKKGTYIPAELEKHQIKKGSQTVTREDFDLIRRLTEQLLLQMAEKLLDGDIAAVPTGEPNHLPCQYCDFRAGCGFTENDPAVYMQSAKTEAVLQALNTEEVNENG